MAEPDLLPYVADLGSQPELMGSGRGTYTGERILRDEPLCLRVVADHAAGLSRRQIASKHGIARESVNVVLMEGEKRGWIRPVLERVTALAAANAEEAARALSDVLADLRDGDRSHEVRDAAFKLAAIASGQNDALRIGMGAPTSIHERKEVRAEVSLEELADLRKRVTAASADSKSGVSCGFAGVSVQISGGDTGSDTAGRREAVAIEAEIVAGPAKAVGGGGGLEPRGAVGNENGCGSKPQTDERALP